jgi:hypothetical protein
MEIGKNLLDAIEIICTTLVIVAFITAAFHSPIVLIFRRGKNEENHEPTDK